MNRGGIHSSRRLRDAAAAALSAAILLFLFACEKTPVRTPPPPPKVTVALPLREKVTDRLLLTGNTQAVNNVQLRARVEGYLEKVFFHDGDMVKKDQPLFLIQQSTYTARLQQAEGNVLAQKALMEHAKIEFARYTALYAQKAAAQTDVENWRYQVDAAQAALMSAEAQRDLARLDLGYTSVTAPFSGRMDRRLVDPGNLVGSGESTALAQLTQMDPLYVYFNVSEADIRSFSDESTGAAARGKGSEHPVYMRLTGEEEYPHEGYLDFSATSVSTTTGTLLVRGVFPNPDGKMRPGQFARVRVPIGQKKGALLVPRVAVSFDELGSYVLTVNEKKMVERRNVKTGATKGDLYVIEEGLTGDEQVIVDGILKAIPGRPVTPETAASPKGPPDSAPSTGND